MEKQIRYCGIDISCDTIDVCLQMPNENIQQETFSNDKKGFGLLLKLCGENVHFVTESTGVYHLPLCSFLQEKNARYSVVNALQVKRYIQMHLERNKSDKKDARHICQYGMERQPECYQMPDSIYFECKTIYNSIETLTEESTAFKNKIHSLEKLDLQDKTALKSYRKILETLQKELAKLEETLTRKLKEWNPEMLELVSSITGIGKRASAILIISTQGFKHTENHRQLISYAGLSPKEYSSGTSIRGKARICKTGGGKLRHTLYMCALNAKAANPACKALFDRLVAKGKNKKLAIIAVCNKLLKQVFAVVKSGIPYDKNYSLNFQ
ncbi:MAG: IS110 family transposase [Edaphocola sp.]